MKQIKTEEIELNGCQKGALGALLGRENIFLTGQAGTGKSTVLRKYLKLRGEEGCPVVVASTGAAAIIVGGRTFHGFFGLGIMEGGPEKTFYRAVHHPKVKARIQEVREVIVDEVSMLSGEVLTTAESICRYIKGSDLPWGGIRMVFVGDFAQLPPVNEKDEEIDWAFHSDIWRKSNLQSVVLHQVMRTDEFYFLDVLQKVRSGIADEEVKSFLKRRCIKVDRDFDGTRLFPRKKQVREFNADRLSRFPGKASKFETEYRGFKEAIARLKKNCPINQVIKLKVGALIMVRVNWLEGRHYVNGSQGVVEKIEPELLTLKMLDGEILEVKKHDFDLLSGDGDIVATAKNFPVTLAWAITIHKSQGATMSRLAVDLFDLWAPGQAYVALSRVRSAKGLFITGWDSSSIIASQNVIAFHNEILKKV